MSGDERARGARLSAPPVPPALVDGAMQILGLLPNSSNYTFLARIGDARDRLLCVYKPRRGEIPLWDFPEGTLCRREVAAFEVSRSLGWPAIPPTVLRAGPEGLGSAQLFIAFDPDQHYFTLAAERPEAFRDIALFDAVVNNADRKGGHCLLAEDGRIFAIDHGTCFNEEPKLRSVIWEFAGEPIPPERLADLERIGEELDGGSLGTALSPLLSAPEIEATRSRVRASIAAGCFPGPTGERPYPWPPV